MLADADNGADTAGGNDDGENDSDKGDNSTARQLFCRLLPGQEELRAAEDALDWLEASDAALVVAFGAARRVAEAGAAVRCIVRRRRRYGEAVALRERARQSGDMPAVWVAGLQVHREAAVTRAGLELGGENGMPVGSGTGSITASEKRQRDTAN